ncbi:thiamine pyrophosphate protein domain protein TPP-binding protein [Novosphingobium nitrogenifigens DSM 19370]|uniref:Pyruvate dehydrogenase [ubiquinone] n=1 Tax=Novosphingobium nitrogenifigens DSM 19370 TaxID=983920 RepID=F1Z5J9_9SPHN|nr:ubiquinone-dependent pyruvate dehydrogenase [Novosphingobium nitrogenifigens]EGD60109.1 thiamine pyrophosphate protein domain protein TPP-binding protein [Novosphingobium nitrogenifigens DSM 19370]
MPTVADQMVETLKTAGVRRIWGIVGDSLNGFTDAIRRRGGIDWLHVRHEESGAFAAAGEAEATGELAVCAGSCGPGNLHLINGLFDAHRSRVPVVAIAAHIPSPEIGSGYFQETHPEELFRECSSYCELVSNIAQMPRALEIAIRRSVAERCVSVIVIPGDIALKEIPAVTTPSRDALLPARPRVVPPADAIDKLASLLDGASRITLLCGGGVAGAHDEVVELASRLKAPIVHALRGKEHIEWDNPYSVGMTGLIGFSSGFYAMGACDVLLMLGTDFPYRQFYPQGAKVVQVDIRPEVIGRRTPIELGVIGDVGETLRALLPKVPVRNEDAHLRASLSHYREARTALDKLAHGKPGGRLHPQHVMRVLSEQASADAAFTADVGLPTVWSARYLEMNGKRSLTGSFWHGSMANAMPQAMGIQAACPNRQVISLSGDGGFSMLMGDLLSLRQLNLPVKVVVFNNSSLGFIELEQKSSGFVDFGTGFDNPDFAAMAQAAGIKGIRIEDPADLESGIAAAFAHPGPVLIDAVVERMELAMPPKVTTEMAKGFTLYMIKAVLNGRGDEVLELARANLLR